MILSYMDSDRNTIRYQRWESYLSEIFGIFFCEMDRDIKIITEKNPTTLRDIITLYKPTLFIVDSLKVFSHLSPTVISELILFLIKNKIPFQSDEESIYFNENNILSVYPTVFEIFRKS
ncbi:MAG: hypothetical protein NTW78_06135 [Campylobacterales bacterium]|nr:hypothetical protein [Campylobacterales bacterium]